MQHSGTVRGREFVIPPSDSGFTDKERQHENKPYSRRLEIDERHAQIRDAAKIEEVWE